MNATERETQTWWRVSRYFYLGDIDALEVVRATDRFVTYLEPRSGLPPTERREGKDTEYYRWLESEQEAVAFARALLTNRRNTLRAHLDTAEAKLAAFNEAHPLPATEE